MHACHRTLNPKVQSSLNGLNGEMMLTLPFCAQQGSRHHVRNRDGVACLQVLLPAAIAEHGRPQETAASLLCCQHDGAAAISEQDACGCMRSISDMALKGACMSASALLPAHLCI